MNPARKFKRGDLVRIRTFTAIDDMMQRKKLYFVGTVLECRYKVGAYCIYPANSPLTTEPYWIDAASLEPLPDT
jgi:hypothetical protein